MPQEFLTLIAPIAGFFVAIFPLRLTYIEKHFSKLIMASKKQKELSDKALQDEIKKKNPDKEKVLSLANEIATFQHVENDLEVWSVANRKQVFRDWIALATIIILGLSLIDNSPLGIYIPHIMGLSIVAGFFSVFSFIDQYLHIHKLKQKKFLENTD